VLISFERFREREAMNRKSPFVPGRIPDDNTMKQVSQIANAIYSNFMTEESDEIFVVSSFNFLLISFNFLLIALEGAGACSDELGTLRSVS
jgi:hypothetical protein